MSRLQVQSKNELDVAPTSSCKLKTWFQVNWKNFHDWWNRFYKMNSCEDKGTSVEKIFSLFTQRAEKYLLLGFTFATENSIYKIRFFWFSWKCFEFWYRDFYAIKITWEYKVFYFHAFFHQGWILMQNQRL